MALAVDSKSVELHSAVAPGAVPSALVHGKSQKFRKQTRSEVHVQFYRGSRNPPSPPFSPVLRGGGQSLALVNYTVSSRPHLRPVLRPWIVFGTVDQWCPRLCQRSSPAASPAPHNA